jgi:hypothetical protein
VGMSRIMGITCDSGVVVPCVGTRVPILSTDFRKGWYGFSGESGFMGKGWHDLGGVG